MTRLTNIIFGVLVFSGGANSLHAANIVDIDPSVLCKNGYVSAPYLKGLLYKEFISGVSNPEEFAKPENSYHSPKIVPRLINDSGLSFFIVNIEGNEDPRYKAVRKVNNRAEYISSSRLIRCLKTERIARLSKPGKKALSKRVRVRGDAKNLLIPLGPSTRSNSITIPATLSYTENFKSKSSIFSINTAVGVSFETKDSDSYVTGQILPYLHVHRRFSSKSGNEVDNFTAGLLADHFFDHSNYLASAVSLNSSYTTDGNARTKVAEGKLVWSLFPDTNDRKFNPFVRWSKLFGPVEMKAELDSQLHYGHVFNHGGNPALLLTDDYLRVGARAALGLRADFGDNIVFDGYARYLLLHGIKGQFKNLDRLDVGINWTFTKLRHFGIGLKYTNGRLDNTFDDVNFFQATFNFKF